MQNELNGNLLLGVITQALTAPYYLSNLHLLITVHPYFNSACK